MNAVNACLALSLSQVKAPRQKLHVQHSAPITFTETVSDLLHQLQH